MTYTNVSFIFPSLLLSFQVRNFGCTAFALLFDDIESDLIEEDDHIFKSVAQAHCTITNNVYNHLGKPDIFLFCPTGKETNCVIYLS